MLRLLQDDAGTSGLNDSGHLLCLMPYDDHRFLRAKRGAGAQHLLDQRAASCAVQDFSKTRLQPRTFSRGKNDNGKIFGRHGFDSFCGSKKDFAM